MIWSLLEALCAVETEFVSLLVVPVYLDSGEKMMKLQKNTGGSFIGPSKLQIPAVANQG